MVRQVVKEVVARLTADTRGLEAGLSKAKRSISDFDNKASAASNNFSAAAANNNNRVSRSFKDLARNIDLSVTAVATAAVAAIGASIKSFIDYEAALAKVGKTTDLAGGDLIRLGDSIRQASREMPVTVDRLLEITQAAGQLGVKGARNLDNFTRTFAKLETATDIAGEAGAQSVARLLTLTEGGVQNIQNFGSAIVGLGNNFAATEAAILRTSTELTGATSRFGFATADILALGTTFEALGVNAEAARTEVGKALQNISDIINAGGQELEQLAAIAGTTVPEFSRLFREDAATALLRFSEGLSQVEGSQISGVLSQFGIEGARAVPIFAKLAAGSGTFADALSRAREEYESNNALQKEFNVQAATLDARIQVLKNRIADTATSLGDSLKPALELVLDRFSKLLAVVGAVVNVFNILTKSVSLTVKGIAVTLKVFFDTLIIDFKSFGVSISKIYAQITNDDELLTKNLARQAQLRLEKQNAQIKGFQDLKKAADEANASIQGEAERFSDNAKEAFGGGLLGATLGINGQEQEEPVNNSNQNTVADPRGEEPGRQAPKLPDPNAGEDGLLPGDQAVLDSRKKLAELLAEAEIEEKEAKQERNPTEEKSIDELLRGTPEEKKLAIERLEEGVAIQIENKQKFFEDLLGVEEAYQNASNEQELKAAKEKEKIAKALADALIGIENNKNSRLAAAAQVLSSIGKARALAQSTQEVAVAASKGLNRAMELPFPANIGAAATTLAAVFAQGSKIESLINSTSGSFKQLSGARADGGPVMAGQNYLVGERGPEIFTPKQNGQIISNEAMQGMGGGQRVVVEIELNDDAASIISARQRVNADLGVI